MAIPAIPFEGVELIPGLVESRDAAGDTAFLYLPGSDPVVIVACHSGTPGTTPPGAKAFGRRTNPADPGQTFSSGDEATLAISLAIIRALTSRGRRPHAVLSLVSRAFVDMNRVWDGQLGWNSPGGIRTPGEIAAPGGADLLAFKAAYYDAFQDAVRNATSEIHPDGWLFDIHGQSNPAGIDLVFFSGYGHFARSDISYGGGGDSLHGRLSDQAFALSPTIADAASEIRNANGAPISNFMSGSAFGARLFRSATDPVPFPGVVAPTEPHRVHGIQLEIDSALRRNRTPEQIEETGLRIGTAIHDALMRRGVLPATGVGSTQPAGRSGPEWFATLGM